ncbi:hypothetical protein M9Y10_042897 [Tritrichomonas musculus]|uniref:non-specific serine/threonine protein kinase n=1 Tax=Tritrichomonas musculus TaxID=1915356 RepID=A0ABR2JYR5_9EUKA
MDGNDKAKEVVLEDVMRRKGTKVGLWRKRFVQLTPHQIIVYKEEHEGEVYQRFDIFPTTTVEFSELEGAPTLIVRNEGNSVGLTLSNENIEKVIRWVNEIRNITLQTPGLSMDNFEILSVIGRGFYGKVMLVKKKDTDELYAIKTVHKNLLIESRKVHTIFAERNVLMKSKHPFIVNICFAFQTETKVYLGLEYVPGGDLYRHLHTDGNLSIEEVRLIIAQLCLAIDYLHSVNVVYRDLKSENVLIDQDGFVKLTDFGLAKALTPDLKQTETFCGTNEYLAPEIIYRNPYGPEIDWWAIGILTYELLYGQPPFHDPSKLKMFKRILNEDPKFPDGTDESIISFISALLTKDPLKRAKFEDLKGHPFFKGINFKDILDKKFKPIYVPQDTSKVTNNFDAEFTNEKAEDSDGEQAEPENKDDFTGFSYFGGINQQPADDDLSDDGECIAIED